MNMIWNKFVFRQDIVWLLRLISCFVFEHTYFQVSSPIFSLIDSQFTLVLIYILSGDDTENEECW